MLGVARSAGSISMGWCVGPSSPSAMVSCVAMYSTRNSLRADRRTAPMAYLQA